MDSDAVVGKLVRLWSWAELNRIDPNDLGVTKEFIDKLVGRKGFAQALEKTGWLIETGEKLSFRNFKRHNSPVAQNKALTAKRVARHRLRNAERTPKVTSKALAEVPAEDPKLAGTTAPEKHVEEVINIVSALVTKEEVDPPLETESVNHPAVIEEPTPEPQIVVETPEIPAPAAVEEVVVEAPAEEANPRKRRGKAAMGVEDQPMLF
jgi:hypothetical protein